MIYIILICATSIMYTTLYLYKSASPKPQSLPYYFLIDEDFCYTETETETENNESLIL